MHWRKFGGALNLPRLTSHDCIRSPLTRTLYLLKPLLPTSLETAWLSTAISYTHLSQQYLLKHLHKLLLHHITKLQHLSLPNGTHLMNHKDFQAYYTILTKLIKTTLKILELLFCQPSCLPHCSNSCTQHYPPRTLLPQYIIRNPHILPSQRLPTPYPPLHPLYPLPPRFILNNLTHFPIHSILDHKEHKIFYKYKIIKKYTSYFYQWTLSNQCIYTKWILQHKLLPWTIQTIPNHNIPL
jgi:hypothetical protein